MKYKLFVLLFCLTVMATAQTQRSNKTKTTLLQQVQLTATSSIDSLIRLGTHYSYHTSIEQEVQLDPYFFPLFISPTLYSAPVRQAMELGTASLVQDTAFALRSAGINRALLSAYLSYPERITHTQHDFMQETSLLDEHKISVKAPEKISEVVHTKPQSIPELVPDDHVEIIAQKPNFWKFSGNYSLQFMQNYVTDNWYKGGESNYSMLAGVLLNLNYNNKQKVVFDNTLELKLGFQSSQSDTIHKFKATTDLVRLTNRLGLRATKHWYYSTMLQTWTQFYPGYKSNNKKVFSDFLSPLQSLFSIGMNYKYNKPKFNISVDISPLALNFTYVGRPSLMGSFGVPQDKHTQFDFGSNITATMSWDIFKHVQWQSRLYCFTSYKKVQAEWENTFNFTINRYLSSKVFLYPRFDDGVRRKQDMSYFQFNEWLSLGLNVNF